MKTNTPHNGLAYLKHFGLWQNPFPVAPDDANFYMSPTIDEIIAEIVHGIRARKGFIMLTGDVGLGKTTITRRILKILSSKDVSTSLVFHTSLKDVDLLREINRDFGLPVDALDVDDQLGGHLQRLNDFLVGQYGKGKNSVIIIDDAQNLDRSSLELVRMISNLEVDQQKIVQILLVGQTELLTTLKSKAMRQLFSRIVIRKGVKSLSREELRSYVQFKLSTAGNQGRISLSASAHRMLYRVTKGNFRRVNMLMDRCLYAICLEGGYRITRATMNAAIEDLNPEKKISRRHALVWAASVMLPVMIALCSWGTHFYATRQVMAKESVAVKVHKVPKPVPKLAAVDHRPVISQSAANGTRSGNQSIDSAVASFLGIYRLERFEKDFKFAIELGLMESISRRIYAETGYQLIKLAYVPDRIRKQYGALSIRLKSGKSPVWVLFWRPALELRRFYYAYQGEEIYKFQELMRDLHLYDYELDGIVGRHLMNAVVTFQKNAGLPMTGFPDPETLFGSVTSRRQCSMVDAKPRKQLGELLKEKGLITEGHIEYALQEQKITRERLGELFERLGFVTEHDVVATLSDQNGVPHIDVDTIIPDEAVLKLFNKNLCLTNAFLPIRVEGRAIEVAAADLFDDSLVQRISRQTGLVPKFSIAEKKKIINAVNRFYYFLENPVERLIANEVNVLSQDKEMARGMDNLVKHMLHLAIKMRATDVHIRPTAKSINISFRVDGVMTSVLSLPPSLNRLVASIKMKADMDIAEQRLPQDGRFNATILNNSYDFRVSTIVLPQGENMVLRILPTESAIMGMAQLGFLTEHIEKVERIFNEPFGIILLTGPTGSGKSTTLYAGIRRLNLLEKNVLTVEEPIEYDIPMLRQTQVNEKAGYNFANAIRYFLRHDPDVILVGEIRDADTAATAVTASTTGHLVLSTLHANSALGAIPRLRDLGIRPFLIADSLIGVVSQRLVRKICSHCKTAYKPQDWEMQYLKDPGVSQLYRGQGCELCNNTGYFGRTLVYELLTVDRELALMIEQEVDVHQLAAKSRESGHVDIFDITAKKVLAGITTTEEALRTLGKIRQG